MKINGVKIWSFIGLFMIMLVLSLPFYSANALAVSVQITKNQGQNGVENYLDAQGDVWTVEALISDAPAETVDPKDVVIKIGENEAPFKTCSASSFGTTCEYISPLTDGVKEDEHAFQVIYTFINSFQQKDSVSDGDFIRADGSSPQVKGLTAKQNAQGQVVLDFTVTDKKQGAPSAGLKKIEIMDGDNGAVLQAIDFEKSVETYNYKNDGGFGGLLKAPLTGEGKKTIKVRAEDNLGHKTTSSAVQFSADFVKPEISSKLNLTRFGDFIGKFIGRTDILVDVVESSSVNVIAYSDQADLDGDAAVCIDDDEIDNLWHCTWKDIEVKPESTVSLLVIAADEYGNKAEKTVSRSLTVDESPPKIKFFGTSRQYEEQSYLKSGENRIVLQAEDEGAGITASGVRANLVYFGGSSSEKPDECTEEEGILECYWDMTGNMEDGVMIFGLSKFEDNVGNEGVIPEYSFIVDNFGPKVIDMEIYGEDKNYFQSNDKIKIKLTIAESSGLNILVNLNDVVMDAENTYLEDEFTQGQPQGGDGWRRFTEESCEREEGIWKCILETEPIKSGPDPSMRIRIDVQDTAGNSAAAWMKEPKNIKDGEEGTYTLDLLGLITEDNPDYWEISKGYPQSVLPFVDLDTTSISYTRMPMDVKLSTDSSAEMLNVELIGCVPASEAEAAEGEEKPASSGPTPAIARSLIYGTNFLEGEASPVTTRLILEFEPFNGRELFSLGSGTFNQSMAEYVCQFKLFSKVEKNAIKAAEIQDVLVKIPFGFSSLGSIDEALKQKVTDMKDSGLMTFFDVIHVIDQVLQWINYVLRILNIIVTVNEIVTIVTAVQKTGADAAEDTAFGTALATALKGACFGTVTATESGWEFVEWIQIPVQILNCNPDVFSRGVEGGRETSKMSTAERDKALQGKLDVSDSALGFYARWQRWALNMYNVASGRWVMGLDATSLYDNFYASILGLCVPGIIHNIEKAREIHCRRIVCYGVEVPAGIATVDSCEQLFDLQMCEFVWGPFFDFFLLGGLAYIGQMLKAAFTSPLGLISLVEYVVCGILCFTPKSTVMLETCRVVSFINKAVSIVDQIVGAVQVRPDVTGSPYCDMADEVDVEQLTGQVKPG